MGMIDDYDKLRKNLADKGTDPNLMQAIDAFAAGDEKKAKEIIATRVDQMMDEQAAHSNAKHAALDEARRRSARYGFNADELEVDAEALIVIKVPHDYAEMNQLGQQLGKWLHDHFGCKCLVMPNHMDIQSVSNRALNQLGLYRLWQMHAMEQVTDEQKHIQLLTNALQAERLRIRILQEYIDKKEGARAPILADMQPGEEMEISPRHRKAFEEARKRIIQCTERATCEKPLEVDAKSCPGQRDV